MPEPLILSASSVITYLQCAYAWYRTYVLRVKSVPNGAMALGTAVHAGVAKLLRGGTMAEAEDEVTWEYAKEMVGQEMDDKAVTDGKRMVATYAKRVMPTFAPTMVEQSFLVTVNGVHFSGQMDAANGGVHDTKTTDGTFRPAQYDFQMTGYGLGYTHMTGKPPTELVLDVLPRSGGYRRYVREPKEGEFADTLLTVHGNIVSQRFVADGAAKGRCGRCTVRLGCKYRREV